MDNRSGTREISSRLFIFALFIVLLSYLNCLEAATADRKPAQPIIPTNNNKNNRNNIMDPAFANAGKEPGLEIWRIENFKPVAYPKSDYGKFYTGDSYIVLFTKVKNNVKSWDIHFWLGLETTQDESTAAAILSVQLDDQLGGGPVQYREVQEHESQEFLSHFKSGVRYVPGGVASGFTHVDRNAHEKKLYQVKGKRNIRVKQVDVSVASMNKGDCFILDIGTDVYVFVGASAKRVEKLKATSVGNQIRDQDNGGRSKVHIVDNFSPQDEVEEFFEKLGGGSLSQVPDESVGGDDEQFETNQEKSTALYKVSDASGKLVVTPVGGKPLKQEMLDTNDCFILDSGDSNIYVWVGRKCTNLEKQEAMNKAQQFLKDKKYPAWTHVQRIVENSEPASFVQYFKTWRGTGESHSRLIRSAGKANPVKTVAEVRNEGTVSEFMPDDGSGEVEVFRIEDFELVPVASENYGKFFGGDSYIVKYRYGGKHLIYIWQGKQSTKDEVTASAMHAVKLDEELGGRAMQIRVTQDNEPKHFLSIFRGKFVIYLGGRASGFKNIKDQDTYVEGDSRMFRVRGTTEDNVRASQQIPSAKYLASDDVFIVETEGNAWIWIGKESQDYEKTLAETISKFIFPSASIVSIKEGQEPAEFWDALGGKTPYNKSEENILKPPREPRLIHAIINKGKKLILENIVDFEQEDLVEDDVMLLDDGAVVYTWIGNGADDHEKKHAVQVAYEYIKKFDRESTIIIVIKQGEEPEAFKNLFPKWEE